jgi:hypothetical protein
MPDRQSTYRQLRLSIYPHDTPGEFSYALLSVHTVQGVPDGQIVARGTMESNHDLNTADGVWGAFQDLAESRRW